MKYLISSKAKKISPLSPIFQFICLDMKQKLYNWFKNCAIPHFILGVQSRFFFSLGWLFLFILNSVWGKFVVSFWWGNSSVCECDCNNHPKSFFVSLNGTLNGDIMLMPTAGGSLSLRNLLSPFSTEPKYGIQKIDWKFSRKWLFVEHLNNQSENI